ncbi:hypothetical protein C6Q28_14510 [Burkholderia multivorans]|nr:hypothetical protein C6Q28_14510 [Burkholderia multivorans]
MAERDDAGEHSATSASRHAAREPWSGAADRPGAKRREARPQRARVALVSMASGCGYGLAPRVRTQAAHSLRAHRTMPATRRLSA